MFRRLLEWLRGPGETRRTPAVRTPARHRPTLEALEDRTVPAQAATVLPAGFEESTLAAGFTMPTSMSFAPDGRLFVTQQNGEIDVIKNGQVLPTPFLTVQTNQFRERGLSSMTFDPNFATNGYVYLYYTKLYPGGFAFNRVSRFQVSATNPDVADPGTETVMLDGIPTKTGFHNGGALHFGNDGMLYVAIGDNGVPPISQRLNSLDGKVLRLNVDAYPNVIPPDNPFVHKKGARPEIFARGFRNPFTFAAVPGSNALFVNDVGDQTWEEVNLVLPGKNYGWPVFEGPSHKAGFTTPFLFYHHQKIDGFPAGAVTGGTFYQGGTFPSSFNGSYFVADYVNQFIKFWSPSKGQQLNGFATNVNAPIDLDVGPDGNLYYLSLGAGAVRKISFVGNVNRPPVPVASADVTSGGTPLTVNFSSAGTSDPENDSLSYSWDFGDGTPAVADVNPTHTYQQAGTYQARLTVTDAAGNVAQAAPVTVTVGNHAPVGTIILPAAGSKLRVKQFATYTATGTDAEDGDLPASAFSWRVELIQNTAVHLYLPPTPGRTGRFKILQSVLQHGHNIVFRFFLKVTDSQGLSSETFRDVPLIRPRR
jgi:glucose/arabinose dehydrogenase